MAEVGCAGDGREAERTEAVVDGDDDEVAVGGEPRPVVPGCGAGAVAEVAAVDPHHHRTATVVCRRRADVEGQAVLVPIDGHGIGHALAGQLRRGRAERGGVEWLGPPLRTGAGAANRRAPVGGAA